MRRASKLSIMILTICALFVKLKIGREDKPNSFSLTAEKIEDALDVFTLCQPRQSGSKR